MGYPHLRSDIDTLAHGGNLEKIKREVSLPHATTWLDLSSAVNKEPWPIPAVNVDKWMALPDLYELNRAASSYYGRNNSLALAGTQQAIEWLPVILPQVAQHLATQDTVIMLPQVGYQEHANAWDKWGYTVCYYSTVESLLVSKWDIAVVINPNNPTTELTGLQQFERLIERAHSQNGYLLVDEAFIDPIKDQSLLSHGIVNDWPESLIVLRSVGKFFGLAGARVGFCFASSAVLSQLQQVIGPWPIATVSAYLTACAFEDREWQKQAIGSLASRRSEFEARIQPLLSRWLVSLGGQVSWRSASLFFCVFLEKAVADEAFQLLQNKGIHIRLGDGWLRFALPASQEFSALQERVLSLLTLSSIGNIKVS
ncbi:aminotransferase class I/II-fold pyridoxal phosphate-dependent enzyme [Marinomonas sp. 15G1-11]|uniref:Aminotransferase n=1 Tax=Marinomonas phaeophyticola TaxID=3004091 RepID=A0ABT4JTT5_9GAMM|nr:aminotransferase class I/II-fold pyridoxal phosphate-dependent enzyme [Marinomonas sp. 15G1-11]MCZ2721004.1 aminotransferase class I/II-fold pyridoxal phosphate-dependent enzyme [Marinomonas sp. 15G1-11]